MVRCTPRKIGVHKNGKVKFGFRSGKGKKAVSCEPNAAQKARYEKDFGGMASKKHKEHLRAAYKKRLKNLRKARGSAPGQRQCKHGARNMDGKCPRLTTVTEESRKKARAASKKYYSNLTAAQKFDRSAKAKERRQVRRDLGV